jgi:hypothetical protein
MILLLIFAFDDSATLGVSGRFAVPSSFWINAVTTDHVTMP